MTTVLIVDDDDLMRAGLVELLTVDPDIEVVGQAADGAEAVRRAVELAPDVVVMDVRMPPNARGWRPGNSPVSPEPGCLDRRGPSR